MSDLSRFVSDGSDLLMGDKHRLHIYKDDGRVAEVEVRLTQLVIERCDDKDLKELLYSLNSDGVPAYDGVSDGEKDATIVTYSPFTERQVPAVVMYLEHLGYEVIEEEKNE
jgi:hypothetical protein